MHTGRCTAAVLATVVALVLGGIVLAQENTPVRISFDRTSKRIDIVTGKILPNYTQVQRGSIQFFQGRLDKPENGFWYYFDGRRFQAIDRTLYIRKLKYTGTWVIASVSGLQSDQSKPGPVPTTHQNINREIEHHAVSFIPLNLSTGKPDPRVYVLVEDMELIQWHPYNHWLITDTQEQLEGKKGTVY